jgi:hypothetical protein
MKIRSFFNNTGEATPKISYAKKPDLNQTETYYTLDSMIKHLEVFRTDFSSQRVPKMQKSFLQRLKQPKIKLPSDEEADDLMIPVAAATKTPKSHSRTPSRLHRHQSSGFTKEVS